MTELEQLEREVTDARLRVKADLQRLRAPHVSLRDEITTSTRRSVDDYRDRFLTNLKDRVAANPVATAAIAAGLAWRLARNPPIATMLIGGGLWSLLRTEPVPGAYDHAEARAREVMDDVTDWAENVKDTVQDRAGAVRDAARGAADTVANTVKETAARGAQLADSLRANAAEAGRAAADTVRETTARGSETAQNWRAQAQTQAENWREQAQAQAQNWRAQATQTGRAIAGDLSAQAAALRQRAPRMAHSVQQSKDAALLGLASVALLAAVGMSAQRRVGGNRLPPR